MYKFSLVVFCLLMQTTISTGQNPDHAQYSKLEFIAPNGLRLPYRLLAPDPIKNKKYPLVLFFHGGGERGNDNEKQLTHGASLFSSEMNRQKFPAYVIFPQCPDNSYWANAEIDRNQTPFKIDIDYSKNIPIALEASIDLVKQLIKTKNIDKKRIYITGLSMGAMGTYEAVYRYPKFWAAALAVCGAADVNAYQSKGKKIPFWVFHGDADVVVNVAHSRDIVSKLNTLGYKVRYTEYPGVNHNSWVNAFNEPEYLSWMFAQKK